MRNVVLLPSWTVARRDAPAETAVESLPALLTLLERRARSGVSTGLGAGAARVDEGRACSGARERKPEGAVGEDIFGEVGRVMVVVVDVG